MYLPRERETKRVDNQAKHTLLAEMKGSKRGSGRGQALAWNNRAKEEGAVKAAPTAPGVSR